MQILPPTFVSKPEHIHLIKSAARYKRTIFNRKINSESHSSSLPPHILPATLRAKQANIHSSSTTLCIRAAAKKPSQDGPREAPRQQAAEQGRTGRHRAGAAGQEGCRSGGGKWSISPLKGRDFILLFSSLSEVFLTIFKQIAL